MFINHRLGLPEPMLMIIMSNVWKLVKIVVAFWGPLQHCPFYLGAPKEDWLIHNDQRASSPILCEALLPSYPEAPFCRAPLVGVYNAE